jgi:hypothetical protein
MSTNSQYQGVNQAAQLHKHNNQTHLHSKPVSKSQTSLYFSVITAPLRQELLKSSKCSLTTPSSSSLSASLSTPFPSRTQTNVATKSALPIKPSAAKSLLMESLSLDALLNAHRFKPWSVDRHTQTNVAIKFALLIKPSAAKSLSMESLSLAALLSAHPFKPSRILKQSFETARNQWPPLQLLRPFPPLDLSAETLSSALLARSAAPMRFTTVPTLTRSANSAPGKWQMNNYLHVHRANINTEYNEWPYTY